MNYSTIAGGGGWGRVVLKSFSGGFTYNTKDSPNLADTLAKLPHMISEVFAALGLHNFRGNGSLQLRDHSLLRWCSKHALLSGDGTGHLLS